MKARRVDPLRSAMELLDLTRMMLAEVCRDGVTDENRPFLAALQLLVNDEVQSAGSASAAA